MPFKEIRTTCANADFILLVAELDTHLLEFYGDQNAFFKTHNKVSAINNVIIIYCDGIAVGCGGIKAYDTTTVEIKRMYVKPAFRKQGIASAVLLALENWAIELGYNVAVLETMKIKDTVINMYAGNGYAIIPNYGHYIEMEMSICMRKKFV